MFVLFGQCESTALNRLAMPVREALISTIVLPSSHAHTGMPTSLLPHFLYYHIRRQSRPSHSKLFLSNIADEYCRLALRSKEQWHYSNSFLIKEMCGLANTSDIPYSLFVGIFYYSHFILFYTRENANCDFFFFICDALLFIKTPTLQYNGVPCPRRF